MKIKKAFLITVCSVVSTVQAQTVTLLSELQQLNDLSQLPVYRTNTTVGQQSSYDRSGGNDDGTDKYLTRRADSSIVMLDVKGSGVLNRIWTPMPTKDTLDLYIDDAVKPVLSICYRDLFDGKIFPFVKPLCDTAVGGYYCYLPIPFKRHLQLICRGKRLYYYQCQYRLLNNNSHVQSFLLPLNLKERAAIETTKNVWENTDVASHLKKVMLQPGTTTAIYRSNIGGRITSISMDTTGTANLRLRITWDKDTEPAVDMPLREFFGYAFAIPAMQGLLAGTKVLHYSRFPMPFDHHARIELVNEGIKAVAISYQVNFENRRRNPKIEGRFYAGYKDNYLTKNDPYHIFLQIKGKGHYIGTTLKATGYTNGLTSFFEGDDSTATDGIARLQGTGSEDYFNGGFYDVKGRWDHAESKPLSGCLGYGREPAQTGGYRFYLNDKIPFEKSFWQGIEHGGSAKDAMPAHYISVSYYYCDRGKAAQRILNTKL